MRFILESILYSGTLYIINSGTYFQKRLDTLGLCQQEAFLRQICFILVLQTIIPIFIKAFLGNMYPKIYCDIGLNNHNHHTIYIFFSLSPPNNVNVSLYVNRDFLFISFPIPSLTHMPIGRLIGCIHLSAIFCLKDPVVWYYDTLGTCLILGYCSKYRQNSLPP